MNSFLTEIPILIQHINLGNHLGHDSLISLLQEARVRFLNQKNLSEKQMILLELQVKYLSEAFHGETLLFQVTATKTGPVRIQFDYLVKEKTTERVVAKATTLMAFYDYSKKKLTKCPSGLF